MMKYDGTTSIECDLENADLEFSLDYDQSKRAVASLAFKVKLQNGKLFDVSVKEAVSARIPQKPIIETYGDYNRVICPCCKNEVMDIWSFKEHKTKFCYCCGQAFLWTKNVLRCLSGETDKIS